MKITFYVLNNTQTSSSPDGLEAVFLAFVCNLTQTVLKKSKQTLIILDDDHNRLIALDRQLWSFSQTSFVPHDLCIGTDSKPIADGIASVAPVIVTDKLPTGFEGVVLNLATHPLNLSRLSNPSNIASAHNPPTEQFDKPIDKPIDKPSRLLEIIPADDINKQKGRDKYKHYRNLGYQLEVHKIG